MLILYQISSKNRPQKMQNVIPENDILRIFNLVSIAFFLSRFWMKGFNHFVRKRAAGSAVTVNQCAFNIVLFRRNGVNNGFIAGVRHAFETIVFIYRKLIRVDLQ